MKSSITLLVLMLGFWSCNGLKVDQMLKQQNPYIQYLNALESSDLKDYAVVQEWKAQGMKLVDDDILIEMPYAEMTFFDLDRPGSKFWKYPVNEGQEVTIEIRAYTDSVASFFMDVFDNINLSSSEDGPKSKYFADADGIIKYEVENSGVHYLRVQPELFRGGMVELKINYQGTLSFPLPDRTTKNIASFWGDPRDGNRRRHEGIDVFAPRGTPVLAASEGRIRRAGNNRLGGKVIWLNSGKGHSQYYAHLDSQLVRVGQKVNLGDTIGYVGNTGNARTTAPHLHFGIYKSGLGALNPLPFVIERQELNDLQSGDTIGIRGHGLVNASKANLRNAPSTPSKIKGTLNRNTYLEIEGKTTNWFRVCLPDGQRGFVHESLVQPGTAPLKKVQIHSEDLILPYYNASVGLPGRSFEGLADIIGYYKGFAIIETVEGFRAWKADR